MDIRRSEPSAGFVACPHPLLVYVTEKSKPSSEQLRQHAVRLLQVASDLTEQAAKLIKRSAEIEKEIASLKDKNRRFKK